MTEFYKKQNGQPILVNPDDHSTVEPVTTKEGGAKITMKTGKIHHVKEDYETVKREFEAFRQGS